VKQPASVADAIIAGAQPDGPSLENPMPSAEESDEAMAEEVATEELMAALDARDAGAFREALRSLIDIMRE
jgi:hypothetical protein